MKNKCKIIEDLLPLYAEDMLSEESKVFVEENIEDCPECKKELEKLEVHINLESDIESEPLRFLEKEIRKDKKLNALAIGLGLLTIFIIILSYITSPIYFPYSKDLIEVTSTKEKHIIEFSENVTGYSIQESFSPDSNRNEVWIEAWRTPLDSLLPPRKNLTLIVEKPAKLVYSPNNEEEAISLGEGRSGSEFKGVLLPRLAQNFYLKVAVILSGVMGIIFFIFKPKKLIKLGILTLPFSYVLAHLSVFLPRGNSLTYNLIRDFIFIILLTIIINTFLLIITKIRNKNL